MAVPCLSSRSPKSCARSAIRPAPFAKASISSRRTSSASRPDQAPRNDAPFGRGATPERRRAYPGARYVEETKVKKLVLSALLGALMTGAAMTGSAMATTVGVSMALFDDNFLTVLRNGIQKYGDTNGVKVQIEDAKNDVAKQLDQINNFVASGVDAIIVNPV